MIITVIILTLFVITLALYFAAWWRGRKSFTS